MVPKEPEEVMDELRLLGNDAAHIEATEFDNVSEDEIAVVVDLH